MAPLTPWFHRSRDMYRHWAPVFKIMAILWIVLALFMLVPLLVLLIENDPDAPAFAVSVLIIISAAALTWLLTYRASLELKPWQMFILTAASWVTISGFASLPLVLGAPQLTFTNAVFESVSAITTTGSTILVGIEHFSDGLKLWRGLMQWMGGIGIIVMGIAILPFLKVGGMRLFHTESSDWSDKVMPRTGGIAKATLTIYVSLTLFAIGSYWFGGMTLLDATVHGMSPLSLPAVLRTQTPPSALTASSRGYFGWRAYLCSAAHYRLCFISALYAHRVMRCGKTSRFVAF